MRLSTVDGPAGDLVETIESTASTTPARTVKAAPAFRGSPQQEAFWEELRTGAGHLVLEARAGTGKSSSCRRGMEILLRDRPGLAIRYCCFNKAIADEFAEGCPDGVEVGTMHKFGLRLVQSAFGSKIDATKTYLLLDDLAANHPRYVRKSIATLVSHAKNQGLVPEHPLLNGDLGELVDAYGIETYRRRGEIVDAAARVLRMALVRVDVVDFDDMLWLPAAYGLEFPPLDFLFIDECQDLNPVQHRLAELMAGAGRTIVVGDPYQAIYGWRGAATDSVERLRVRLGAKTLPLTVSWRCPRRHVELARRLVADFEAAPDAIEGDLEERPPGDDPEPAPGALYLCRLNAPLIHRCLTAIADGRRARMRGRSIGDDLVRCLREATAARPPATRAETIGAITAWRGRKLEALAVKEGVESQVEQVDDQAKSLEAIASRCASPAEMKAAIDRLFSDDPSLGGFVTYSSVHRAKGSEANEVHYLQAPYGDAGGRPGRGPQPWEFDQRRNLRYVALTRSRRSLTLLS